MWRTPITPAFEWQGQEDCKFEARLDYEIRPGLKRHIDLSRWKPPGGSIPWTMMGEGAQFSGRVKP